jgi:ATP-dependent DNA helicase RecQ
MNIVSKLTESLQAYFGFESFRPGQLEIIKDIMKGEDVLGVLPTGSGKSICYQLPALLLGGSTIVVTPLISLMEDQVKQLKAGGFKGAVALNSLMNPIERKQTIQSLDYYHLIYVSPELLQQKKIQERLKQLRVSLFVIDEAHCISQWGYEFRPDYLKLEEITESLNRPPILALSATAPAAVQKDILHALKRPGMKKHIYPMDRENIVISIKKTEDDTEKIKEISDVLSRFAVPTLIYFSSRNSAETIAKVLSKKHSRRIAYYHGGLDPHDRIAVQQQFMHNQLDVICCTNAFGMGINKPDIRQVIHFHFPSQLEAYIQEAGRAGRDGKSSSSLILYSPRDSHIPKSFISNELPSTKALAQVFRFLQTNRTVPSSLEKIMEAFRLNETQWRFLQYQLEKHAIIKDNRLIAGSSHLSYAFNQITDIIHNRTAMKENKLTDMLSWLQSEGCLREALYKSFQPTFSKPDGPCCSNCGFILSDWKPEQSDLMERPAESWSQKLRSLFMIGENIEAK